MKAISTRRSVSCLVDGSAARAGNKKRAKNKQIGGFQVGIYATSYVHREKQAPEHERLHSFAGISASDAGTDLGRPSVQKSSCPAGRLVR